MDSKGTSDLIDSLGFLCHEAVGRITEEGLRVKKIEVERERRMGESSLREREVAVGLFAKSGGNQSALLPSHVQEAYR